MVQEEKPSKLKIPQHKTKERKTSGSSLSRSPLNKTKLNSLYKEMGRVASGKEGLKNADKVAKYVANKENTLCADNIEPEKQRPLSQDDRATKKFSHTVYDKAAVIFDCLSEKNKSEVSKDLQKFDSEFERRRAYSLAFAAKRYEAVLKDVLLDSSFYSSYFKLETFHHSKVMVMLLDYYKHNFRFSDSQRNTPINDNTLDHIHEIQKAFYQHNIKICSAFARNRIKACALTLEGLLPSEVKEKGECGARHPLYMRINFSLTDRDTVQNKLAMNNFLFKDGLVEISEDEQEDVLLSTYSIDKDFENLMVFPVEVKDDIFNDFLALEYHLIPQSKPSHIIGELTKDLLISLSETQKKAAALIPGDVDFISQTGDILLTHPEAGALASHLDSYLENKRKLIICGCVGKKYDEISKILKLMNVSNVELLPDRFVDIQANDERLRFCKIIVCNPPSSNSGVVNPVDFVLYEGSDAAVSLTKVITASKLRGLIEEQRMSLQHALQSSLVQSVLYFTFSTEKEENQNLLDQVLQNQNAEKRDNLFAMHQINERLMKNLQERHGASASGVTKYLSMPATSVMDGFFVTILTKKVREETVREVMDRVSKNGLLKKTTKSPVKKKTNASLSPYKSTGAKVSPKVNKSKDEKKVQKKKSLSPRVRKKANKEINSEKKTEFNDDDDERGRQFKF